MTSIVLAGGRSSRLGREKAWLKLGGSTLLKQVVSKLALLDKRIVMVISQRQQDASFDLEADIERVIDIYPDKGSLGGIYTGLVASKTRHSLVVGCDMPFLNLGLLRYMMRLAPSFDVVIPRIGGDVEPLHAIYSQDCVAPIETLIEQDQLRIVDFFPQVKVRYMEEDELDRFDPEHLSFFNINTKADLKRARKLAEGE